MGYRITTCPPHLAALGSPQFSLLSVRFGPLRRERFFPVDFFTQHIIVVMWCEVYGVVFSLKYTRHSGVWHLSFSLFKQCFIYRVVLYLSWFYYLMVSSGFQIWSSDQTPPQTSPQGQNSNMEAELRFLLGPLNQLQGPGPKNPGKIHRRVDLR